MKNPAMILSGTMEALQALAKSAQQSGISQRTLDLAHLRASQINGCSVCVDMGFRFKKPDETEQRLFAVAAWRDAPYFDDAERAALALTEAVTRLSDRENPVPDDVWEEASRHYAERALAALILWIAATNVWNRLNVSTAKWQANGRNPQISRNDQKQFSSGLSTMPTRPSRHPRDGRALTSSADK
jgi:alkylhydroperoxidase family enzyme